MIFTEKHQNKVYAKKLHRTENIDNDYLEIISSILVLIFINK